MQKGLYALVASIPAWKFYLFVNAIFVFVTAFPKPFKLCHNFK